jgi:hypothetical protein
MATIYSLVCFGGRTGKAVTISNGSPAVSTMTDHGVRNGLPFVYATTGALPSPLVAGTTYYARYVTATTFHTYDTEAHAKDTANTTGRIVTTTAGSGTHTAGSAYWANLSTADRLRYGAAGAELVYNGVVAWNTGRASATAYNAEVCEMCDPFVDLTPYGGNTGNYNLVIAVVAASITFTSKVKGVRSKAWHAGVPNTGYSINMPYNGYSFSSYNVTMDGYMLETANSSCVGLMKIGSVVQNMIIKGGGTNGVGISMATGTTANNNLVYGFDTAISIPTYQVYVHCANNTCVKNKTGIAAGAGYETTSKGSIYNNLCIGNSVKNWGVAITSEGLSNNAGLAGEAWMDTARIEIGTDWNGATPLFMDYANNDFRPYASGGVLNANSSLIVEGGLSYFGVTISDIMDNPQPNYINGTTDMIDVGCYEFDHGNGLKPITVDVTLTNLVAGSRVRIAAISGGTELYNDVVSGTTLSFSQVVGADTPVGVSVRKASASPYYQPYYTAATISAAYGLTLSVNQALDE